MNKKKDKDSSTLIIIILLLVILGLGVLLVIFVNQDNKVCLELQNESFINGTVAGGEYVIAIITSEVIQCRTLPINYANYSYTLVAKECLNLSEINNG